MLKLDDVIEAIAGESGVDPIVVETHNGWQLWRGGRMVEVGIEVLLADVDAYRRHWKSISVGPHRHGLDGAARAVRIALVGGLVNEGTTSEERLEPVPREERIAVDVDDLRELLESASAELRDAYAHALDRREPEDA